MTEPVRRIRVSGFKGRSDSATTIMDVARLANVSKSTASLSFSTPERVSEKTLERVLAAAQEIGYSPNAVARSLKTGRNNLIGFVTPDMRNPHSGATLSSVQEHASRYGCLVITATSHDSIDRELDILEQFRGMQIKGTILIASGQMDDYKTLLSDLPMTIVTLDQNPGAEVGDHVGLDNRLASRMLTQHLIDLGHRRIAHVAGTPGLWTSLERAAGVRDTMAAAGLSLEEEMVVNGNFRAQAAYEATVKLLSEKTPPTAIVAANNASAAGALRAIRALGLKCPEDVSLVSVDAMLWSELVEPRITCTAQPVERIAGRAAEWLLERMNANEDDPEIPHRSALLVPEIMYGNSTAAPRR